MTEPTGPVEVIHLDLSRGFTEEHQGVGKGALQFVFWWGDTPLGQLRFGRRELPTHSGYLRQLISEEVAPAVRDILFADGFRGRLPEVGVHEEGLDGDGLRTLVDLDRPLERLSRTDSFLPSETLSVIICTRDRPEHLGHCLRSLCSTSSKPDEIIVVDNAPSTDLTRKIVAEYPDVRYELEPRPGLDRARNRGVVSATSDIVAFVDDDVTVHQAWGRAIRESFRDKEIQAVTGLVLPLELETEAQVLFEWHWSFGRGYRERRYDAVYFKSLQSRGVPAWIVGAGANMAFRRSLFAQVGLFDELLDVGAAGCNGDSEMWYRILAVGGVCQYAPRAVGFHRHRRTIEGLSDQLYHYMRGHTAALCVQFTRHLHWGNLVRLVLFLPTFYVRYVLDRILHGFRPRHQFLWSEIRGCVSGVLYFVSNLHRWQRVPHRSGGISAETLR